MTTTEQIEQLKKAIDGGEMLSVVLSEQQKFELGKWMHVLQYRLWKLENGIPESQASVAEFHKWLTENRT